MTSNKIQCPAGIEESVRKVNASLYEIFKSIDKDVYNVETNPIHLTGKSVRTRFTLLLGDTLGLDRIHSERISVCAELVHMASLFHDDLIDLSVFRRGQPSIWERMGVNYSILLGDLIVTYAVETIDKHYRDLTRELVLAVRKMVTGEMLEENFRYKKINREHLLKILSMKTGALFRWCAISVCHLSGNHFLLEDCAKIGEQTGISYQIIDDVIDFETENTISGKDGLKDVREGKITLPLLFVLEDKQWTDIILAKMAEMKDSGIPDIAPAMEIAKIVKANGFTTRAREFSTQMIKQEMFALIDRLPNYERAQNLKNYLIALADRKQ